MKGVQLRGDVRLNLTVADEFSEQVGLIHLQQSNFTQHLLNRFVPIHIEKAKGPFEVHQ